MHTAGSWARASHSPIRLWRIYTLFGELILQNIRQMANFLMSSPLQKGQSAMYLVSLESSLKM